MIRCAAAAAHIALAALVSIRPSEQPFGVST